MDTLVKQFESFLKRSMLPASFLLLLLFAFSLKDEKINTFFKNFNLFSKANEKLYLTILIGLILLISLSYILSIFTQYIFDNRMKKNFNSILFYKNENETLNILRKKTISKLQKENSEFKELNYTDYLLYQIIGRKLQFLKYPTSTKRYIDEIKSAGSIFISILISLLIFTIIHSLDNCYMLFLGFLVMGIIYFIAIEYLLLKYRSRAIRIYINYLIGDNKSI